MAKAKQQPTPEADSVASDPEPAAAPRPPQGIVPRYFETGVRAVDFHRLHQPAGPVAGVRRIDPASLRSPEGHDPFLRHPKGVVIQVQSEHAAELLECSPTGGPSEFRLATDDEIAAERARQLASLRRR